MNATDYIEEGEYQPFSMELVRKVGEEVSFAAVVWKDGSKGFIDGLTANRFIRAYDTLNAEQKASVSYSCSVCNDCFNWTVDAIQEHVWNI